MTESNETRYIEWDYNLMEATEYQRIGECNRCGECCQAHIAFQVAFQDNDDLEKLDLRNGGDTTKEVGIWNEVDDGDDRVFFRMMTRDINGHGGCHRLTGRDQTMQQPDRNIGDAGCSIYERRPRICSDFPLSPADVAAFPSCSYSFEEIAHWKIEDLED